MHPHLNLKYFSGIKDDICTLFQKYCYSSKVSWCILINVQKIKCYNIIILVIICSLLRSLDIIGRLCIRMLGSIDTLLFKVK